MTVRMLGVGVMLTVIALPACSDTNVDVNARGSAPSASPSRGAAGHEVGQPSLEGLLDSSPCERGEEFDPVPAIAGLSWFRASASDLIDRITDGKTTTFDEYDTTPRVAVDVTA